jgi:excinuclease ABC subunit C
VQKQDKIKEIVSNLPEKPGVYQFFDKNNTLLYVGKAKSLKKRVSSYFTKEHDSGRIRVMVNKIEDIKYIVVDTELDALLLENNLIKSLKPRYNINLRDDKTYPWICIKNEEFPRVYSTRNPVYDGSLYFGPYASVKMMNTLLDLIRQLYKLRTCNLVLSDENIEKGKFKVCLEYHIGNCLGPCEGFQKKEQYHEQIQQIKEIIKGNISGVIRHLKELMHNYAKNLDFENAQVIKEKIELLEKYQSKSAVVSNTITNLDVFSIDSIEDIACVNYLKIIDGTIVQAHTIELKKKLEESDKDLLEFAIVELRERFKSSSREIIVPFQVEIELPNVTFTVPQRGDKMKLLELSQRNAKFYRIERQKANGVIKKESRSERILEQMKKDLRLPELPRHIECFDNSNIMGEFPVSACVVFKDAKPSKKDYRHFNIKTVEGPNDFASMEEVIYRRYKRLLEENQPLPQLIVIDGGKGQLSSAVESLEKLGLRGKISIISIAKRLEEIYYPNDPFPLHLNKKSETLKIIQHMRDEAHRFGITHHRNKRTKALIITELHNIDGIGENTIEKLLKTFGSVKRVKEASYQALESAVGKAKAKIVSEYFRK